MIDKTTSRVILGLLGTACILITAFAWYKTSHAASPDAGMRHNIYDEDVPRSAQFPPLKRTASRCTSWLARGRKL